MGLHFIFNGAHDGDPGVIATLQENPVQLERIVRSFGWTLQESAIELMYRSPVDVYIDEWVYDLLAAAERDRGAARCWSTAWRTCRIDGPGRDSGSGSFMYSLYSQRLRTGRASAC